MKGSTDMGVVEEVAGCENGSNYWNPVRDDGKTEVHHPGYRPEWPGGFLFAVPS